MTLIVQLPSDEKRRVILYLEAVALLHDIGKLSEGFLKAKAANTPPRYDFNYELRADIAQVFPSLASREKLGKVPKELRELFKQARNVNAHAPYEERPEITAELAAHDLQAWDGHPYTLAELVLLAAQWTINHDKEKWEEAVGKPIQPAQLVGRLHGAAHYEKPNITTGQQRYETMCRASPFGDETVIQGTMTALLQALPLGRLGEILTGDRPAWLSDMRGLLQQGIGDTRRAINEVTLWDWGYTVAALTKPAAYTILQTGEWPDDLKQLSYRTLSINLDLLRLYGRSDKISDLLGVRAAVAGAYAAVQTLLEETYALGNRIYHDETGAYYLLPAVADVTELKEEIQAAFPVDLKPQVHLGERVTIAALDARDEGEKQAAVRRLIVAPRTHGLAARQTPVVSDNNLFLDDALWREERPANAEICTVCGTRPVGYPRHGSDAEPSLLREQGYAMTDSWATQEKAEERNVCRFCLFRRGRRSQEWLAGEGAGTIWADEVADGNGRLALFVGSLGLDDWLNGTLLQTLRTGREPGGKNASPARLYRIAETARTFWQSVIDDTMPATVGQRPYRLAIHPAQGQLDLGHAHAYELDLGGIVLSVAWDRENERFLTTENLHYFASRWSRIETAEALPAYLQGRTLTVREPSEFLSPGAPLIRITVADVREEAGYSPTIPLLAEPGLGMMLVPAAAALPLAHAVKEKYQAEMARVLDRLPLDVGLVYFRRRTPLAAVLDAGRRMQAMPRRWEAWEVAERDGREVTFSRDGHRFTHVYPTYMGDGETEDVWYPYLSRRDPAAEGADLEAAGTLARVDQVDEGSTVYLRPGHFDFEFLDTTGRRFEINYGTASGRRPLRTTRPFLLHDLDRLATLWDALLALKVSQRHQVILAIEATREAWYGRDAAASLGDGVFARFVADTLAGAAWPAGWHNLSEEVRDGLVSAGIRGELADLAELHMQIMKQPREEAAAL